MYSSNNPYFIKIKKCTGIVFEQSGGENFYRKRHLKDEISLILQFFSRREEAQIPRTLPWIHHCRDGSLFYWVYKIPRSRNTLYNVFGNWDQYFSIGVIFGTPVPKYNCPKLSHSFDFFQQEKKIKIYFWKKCSKFFNYFLKKVLDTPSQPPLQNDYNSILKIFHEELEKIRTWIYHRKNFKFSYYKLMIFFFLISNYNSMISR